MNDVAALVIRKLPSGHAERINEPWPELIMVSEELLACAAEGRELAGAVEVSGVIQPQGSLRSMVWTSITFRATCGSATYALEQRISDFAADRWTARLISQASS